MKTKNNLLDYIKTICLITITLSILSIALSLFNISNKQNNRYDVNGDGVVNAVDYVLIKNYIMGENK